MLPFQLGSVRCFSECFCRGSASHKARSAYGVTSRLLTLVCLLWLGPSAIAQDSIQPNSNVLLSGTSANPKNVTTSPIGTAQSAQSLQNELAHKIGVRTQSNLGNVNSPSLKEMSTEDAEKKRINPRRARKKTNFKSLFLKPQAST